MKKPRTATALKAYLQNNNIRPSSLAKKCQIDEGYFSRLLNGQRSNPSFSVLILLADELGLPVDVIQKLLQKSYDSFVDENNPKVLLEQASKETFIYYLQQVLDASDQSKVSRVADLTKIISDIIPDSVPLKSLYLTWHEAYNLTIQNKFEASIPMFEEASKFISRSQIEKRFKAKILVGLGTAYMASGNYRQSIHVFRRSLLLWNERFQVARVNMNLGTLYRRISKYEFSKDAYEKAYEFGTSTIKLYALSGLIQLALDKEDYSTAREYVIRGYIQAKRFDSPRGKGDLYCNIAEYYSAIGKLHQSELFFKKTIVLAEKSGNPRAKQWAEVELAVLFLKKGSVNEFNALIQRLESELSGYEDVLVIVKYLNAKGGYHLKRREYSLIIFIVEKAYKLLNTIYPPPLTEFKECCKLLYETYKILQEPNLAHYYLSELKRLKRFEGKINIFR